MKTSLQVGLFLAIRGIIQGNKYLFALTSLILTVVFINLTFLPALLLGFTSEINRQLIDSRYGNIIITSKSEDKVIQDIEEKLDKINKVEGVVSATKRYELPITISYNNIDKAVNAIAIDVSNDESVFKLKENMLYGNYFENVGLDQIIMGKQIAGANTSDLELYASSFKTISGGETVSVKFPNSQVKYLKVSGIFFYKYIESDVRSFISYDQLIKIYPDLEDSATTINIKIDKDYSEDYVISQINKLNFESVEITSWEENSGVSKSVNNSFGVIRNIFSLVAISLGCLTIFIFTYVDLINRKKQIGIQRAIGISDLAIISSYVFKAIAYAIVGRILGSLVMFFLLDPIFQKYTLSFPFGDASLVLSYFDFVVAAILIFIASISSSIIPSIKATRENIVKSIYGI